MTSLPAPRLGAARLAVSVLFFANGMASASILPRLPAIKDGLGLTNAELGAAVAALPLGGLIAGGLAGILMAKFGSGRVAAIAGTLDVLAIAMLGFAPSWLALAGAYFVMGMFDATMDAAMNTHGVGVERVYGRSILQGFHGAWSAGCMVAGVVGAFAAGLRVPVGVHLTAVGVVMAAAILLTARNLLPASLADVRPKVEGEDDVRIHPRNAPHLLRVLVPVAMLGILTVGVQTAAATWSSIFGTDVLGLTAGLAAVGYVLYAAGMTVFRMLNDRWIDGLGTTRFVRIFAVVSFLAMIAVIASAPLHAPLLAFAGFAGIGVGTSPMFPVMAAVSGSLRGIPAGYGVALTSWLVRVGLMVAPALIGAAADALGLATALWIPAAAAAAILVFAPAMTREGARPEVRVGVAA